MHVADELSGQQPEGAGRTVLRHSIMTFGTRMGIVLINIPTSILVARLLGADGQGVYASAIIFPTMFAFIGLLGLDSSHTYLLSRGSHRLSHVNGQSLILLLVFSAIITPVYILFIRFYRGAADPDLAGVLMLAAVLIPVLLAKYLSVALLLGLQRIRSFNLANIIQAGTLLGFMCVNLFVFRGGARGALIAYIASEITVTLVAYMVVARAACGHPMFERPERGMLRRSLVYGLQGHVGNVLTQFTYRFDMFLVLSVVGIHAQGLYSISVVLAEKLSHIPQSVQVVLFPKLASMEPEEADLLTPRVTRNSLAITAVAGLALYGLSRPLLLLFYSTEYLGALQAFRVLIPGIVALSISKILASDFSGRDKRIYQTIATGVAFAVNVTLCFLWIPRHGIEGAAWASTAAYTLQSVLMLVFFRRLSGRGLAECLIVRGEDLALYGRIVARFLRRDR